MNVGGGIAYVEGPMGSGKTYFGVREAVKTLAWDERSRVVTNIPLYPDAFDRVARHYAWARSGAARRRFADDMQRRYVYTEDIREAFSKGVRARGKKFAPLGRVIWDEAHNDVNNRTWRGGAKQTAEQREEIIERGTQLRKLGMLCLLLSQHSENTDKALRRIANYHVLLYNQRERTRVFGVRVTPWPMFLAYWMQASIAHQSTSAVVKAEKPLQVDRYFLGWFRHLYDTHGLYHSLRSGDTGYPVEWLDDEDGSGPPAAAPHGPLAVQERQAA